MYYSQRGADFLFTIFIGINILEEYFDEQNLLRKKSIIKQ